jgi:DeoR family transcriptional regulator, suf operon transcriptional repressor
MHASQATSPSTRSTPPGFLGLRGDILVELKKAERLTTRQLADRLSCSPNTVRHHLKGLEEQGLVVYQREHRGVGAPTFAYQLTPLGEQLFPRQYQATLGDLLDHIVAREGRAAAAAMLAARYSRLAQQLQRELTDASPLERLQAVAAVLSNDGYMAEGAKSDASTATLTEHNCAILAVAQRFPEICDAEAKFLQEVLGGEIRRERHILNGCSACEYRVRFDSPGLTARGTVGSEPAPSAPSIQENS